MQGREYGDYDPETWAAETTPAPERDGDYDRDMLEEDEPLPYTGCLIEDCKAAASISDTVLELSKLLDKHEELSKPIPAPAYDKSIYATAEELRDMGRFVIKAESDIVNLTISGPEYDQKISVLNADGTTTTIKGE